MVNKRAIILLTLAAVIVIFPLAIYNGKTGNQGIFGGSDDQGSAYISSTGYTPWFHSLWTPPSTEVESLLFAIQAAIGALIVGYILGYYKGKAKNKRKDEAEQNKVNKPNR